MKVYVMGSLRNPNVPSIAAMIRGLGYEVFDDWHSGGPEADDYWQAYEKGRGHTFVEALDGDMAWHIFEFDKRHLESADIGVLVMPAGKSAHLELGYMAGQGKLTYILLPEEPERFDVMYRFATQVFLDRNELIYALREVIEND